MVPVLSPGQGRPAAPGGRPRQRLPGSDRSLGLRCIRAWRLFIPLFCRAGRNLAVAAGTVAGEASAAEHKGSSSAPLRRSAGPPPAGAGTAEHSGSAVLPRRAAGGAWTAGAGTDARSGKSFLGRRPAVSEFRSRISAASSSEAESCDRGSAVARPSRARSRLSSALLTFRKRAMEDMRAESGVEPVVVGHRVTLHTRLVPPRFPESRCATRPRASRASSEDQPFYPDSRGTVNNDCGNSLPRMRPRRRFREEACPPLIEAAPRRARNATPGRAAAPAAALRSSCRGCGRGREGARPSSPPSRKSRPAP